MSERLLHITVAAVPNTEFGNPRILDHELRLAKASILYADRVRLCSMSAWMASSFYFMGNFPLNEIQKLEILISIAPAIAIRNPDAVNLPEFQKLLRLFKQSPITLTRRQRHKKKFFKEKISEIWEQFQPEINKILTNFGFDEIEFAANYGFLEIHPFLTTGDELPHEYLSVVEEMLSSSDTHPMLDEQTSDLVRLALQEGKMSIGNSATKKSKQIGLVADLFDRLPIFDVRMDELLDLRDELQNPLIRFRAEMVKLSKDIETAAWDKDFPSDVQETYQEKIEPALLEIEEKLQSTAFKEFWSRRIVDKYGYLAGSLTGAFALGAAVSPLSGIAAALLTSSLFIKTGQSDLKEKINEIERNGLYFYYKVKKQLDSSK